VLMVEEVVLVVVMRLTVHLLGGSIQVLPLEVLSVELVQARRTPHPV
jgi:hypothetical protein